jgi:uncharacterized protein YyaL (SSP411 family)
MRRNGIRGICGFLIVWGALTGTLPAEEPKADGIAWHEQFREAWAASQEKKRPLLVFVTIKDCAHCRHMVRQTYADAAVASDVRDSFVAATVDADRDAKLVEKLGVRVYPTTVIISPDLRILDRIGGYAGPAELRERMRTAVRVASKPDP